MSLSNHERSAGSAHAALVVVLAGVFLACHLPYLPASLEDLDSINFALGIRHFDVARHQPHPPGYPLFILAARAAHAVMPPEAHALAIVSALAGTCGVLAMAALFRRLEPAGGSALWPIAATAVAVTAPLYWFTAARPLSDTAGLAAALAVQALVLGAETSRQLSVASFCAAFTAGLRSQVIWLTLPLLLVRASGLGFWRRSGLEAQRASAPGSQPAPSPRRLAPVVLAYLAGGLAWLAPLLVVTGGPLAYRRALFNQGAEDLTGVRMLWTTPTVRELADALYYAFIAPWAAWPLAAVMLALASAGIVVLWRRNRRALTRLAVAFAPYFVFDLLFQETFTSRYALPLVVPIAYLAASGARILPAIAGLAAAIAVSMFGAHAGGTSVAAYARRPAPAFRLIADMQTSAKTAPQPAVLAMDRREDLDLRRPIVWTGEAASPFARRLPAPPQHEWLELVKYWNGGGRAPVWFVADPRRTDIDLVQHRAPDRYRWNLPYPVLIDGVRPNEMDWYRLARPEWYAGEGWALTPEVAGVSEADHRGLQQGPIEAWIARETLGGRLILGGRNLEPSARSELSISLDGLQRDRWMVPPGFFVRTLALPLLDDSNGRGYVRVTINASPPSRVAIEQFDASAARPLLAFGDGWHEGEFNPQTGLRWRWLSERGELRVVARGRPVALRIAGESPRRYFSRGSKLTVQSGGRAVFGAVLDSDFALTIPIPSPADAIAVETDQIYVPAERSRRARDRRHLGLRIFDCRLVY